MRKREKCVFIGYSVHMKLYKLYNSVTNKVFFSRNVKFDETKAYNWKGKEKEEIEIQLEEKEEREHEPKSPHTPHSSPSLCLSLLSRYIKGMLLEQS